jgi:methylmalonyl-CoA mutase cobalamin-binding domain/chain
MKNAKARIVLGKIGLDSHDNGLQTVAKWLLDAGYEVVYLGLFNTPDRVVRAAEEEDARIIGVSFLGGEHMIYSRRLMELIGAQGKAAVRVVVGGVIPPDDAKTLREMGVSLVFGPGTSRADMLTQISALVPPTAAPAD